MTVWKVSKYGVFSGPYLDIFHAVNVFLYSVDSALRENCSNMEFFLVCIFPHSDWMRRDTEYLSVFSPNTEKYGPGKTPYVDIFHVV